MKDLAKKSVKKLKPTSRSIVRQKVWVDTKILNVECCHLSNKAIFAAFKSDADPSIVPKNFAKNKKLALNEWVCFSGLPGTVFASKANRVYDRLEIMTPGSAGRGGRFLLKPKERVAWISLAKKYRMLPKYTNENAIIDLPKNKIKEVKSSNCGVSTTEAYGEFIFDLEGLSPAVLYIYLSTIRNLREDPGLPKAVLYLVNDLGMNFYAAYVFASKIVINATGHHILGYHRPYGAGDGQLSQERLEEIAIVPLHIAIGLQRIVNNDPSKYDKRNLTNPAKEGDYYSTSFKCAGTIEKISKVRYEASLQELFDEDIIAAIMSKDDREAEKFIDKFKNKKKHIKYRRASK